MIGEARGVKSLSLRCPQEPRNIGRGVGGGYLGGALLERGVDEAQVRVVVSFGVHPRPDQVLDCQLYRLQSIPSLWHHTLMPSRSKQLTA